MGREEASAAPDLVTGAFAIRQLLDELSRSHAPLSISRLGSGFDTLTGWIEQVDGASGWLRPSEIAPDAQIRPGNRFRVQGRLDGVAIIFTIEVLDVIPTSDAPGALCRFPLPASAERLQRRGAYRVRAPRGRLGEVIRRINGSERRYPVLDLSGDGVGILAADAPGCDPDELWRHCRLEIANEAPIPCDLTVRTLSTVLDGFGTRIGCSFERPSPEAKRAIEKFVLDFQRASRGLNRA